MAESKSFVAKTMGFYRDYNSSLGKYLVDTKANYYEIFYNGTAKMTTEPKSLLYLLEKVSITAFRYVRSLDKVSGLFLQYNFPLYVEIIENFG